MLQLLSVSFKIDKEKKVASGNQKNIFQRKGVGRKN